MEVIWYIAEFIIIIAAWMIVGFSVVTVIACVLDDPCDNTTNLLGFSLVWPFTIFLAIAYSLRHQPEKLMKLLGKITFPYTLHLYLQNKCRNFKAKISKD